MGEATGLRIGYAEVICYNFGLLDAVNIIRRIPIIRYVVISPKCLVEPGGFDQLKLILFKKNHLRENPTAKSNLSTRFTEKLFAEGFISSTCEAQTINVDQESNGSSTKNF